MGNKIPILLSFYACTNGKTMLAFGQLTFTRIKDLTFKDYSQQKTFRTLLRLYQTRPYANQALTLVFEGGTVKVQTNSHGAFYTREVTGITNGLLTKVLMADGQEVKLMESLYERSIHQFTSHTIVVSDLDDTLMHSYIYRKLHKIKTLVFTTVEKRKIVSAMQQVIQYFVNGGAESIYLSNSEQNLYPIIYRFLEHNRFPKGPIFLKQLRSMWDVLWNIKFPLRNVHKITTIEHLIALFPEKKFVLLGDNTQHDLPIYIDIAYKYPQNIAAIFIRKVIGKPQLEKLIDNYSRELSKYAIRLYYAESFPQYEPGVLKQSIS